MRLNGILGKFNLVFSVSIACASVTSAAMFIAQKRALTSSSSSFGYKIGGGSSSSNEAQKAFSGGKGFAWGPRSNRNSGLPTSPEILIYSSAFLDGNPFDRHAFSVPPLEFSMLASHQPYTHPEIELPFLEEAKTHSFIGHEPTHIAKPELVLSDTPHRADHSQTTDIPSQESTPLAEKPETTPRVENPVSSVMPDMTRYFEQAIETFEPTPQAHSIEIAMPRAKKSHPIIQERLPQLQRAEVVAPTKTEVITTEVVLNSLTAQSSLENLASSVMPNMTRYFEQTTETFEQTPQLHPIEITISRALQPHTIIKTQLPQLQRAEVLTVEMPSSDAVNELIPDYEEILSRLAAFNLGNDEQEELEFSEDSIAHVSDFSSVPDSPVSISNLLDALLSPTHHVFRTKPPRLQRSLSTSSLPNFVERRTPERISPRQLETLLDELNRLDELGSDAYRTTVPESLRLQSSELETLLDELEQLDALDSSAHNTVTPASLSSVLSPEDEGSLIGGEDLDLGSLFEEHDSEEAEEWGSAVPTKAHAIKLLKVNSELLKFFEKHGPDWSGREAHKSLLQNVIHPDLLKTTKVKPTPPQPEAITTVFSPTSRALIVSPPRVPLFINGIDISHDSLLPNQLLWMEAEAASAAVRGAVASLMQDTLLGLSRILRPQAKMNLTDVPNWAVPLAGLNAHRNPLLLGLNAALRAHGVDIFQQRMLKARSAQVEPLPTAPSSPMSKALIVSPPRVPTMINGIDISHDTLLPSDLLRHGMAATSAAVRGAFVSLMHNTLVGISRTLRPQMSIPNWAMPLAGLNTHGNPLLLGMNAALSHYQRSQIHSTKLNAEVNPFSVPTAKRLAQFGAKNVIQLAQEKSKPKEEGTPSPVRAAKRSLDEAFAGLAETSVPKRVDQTPMRDELITAVKQVVREVSELASPMRTPLQGRRKTKEDGYLPSTPVIRHPLMPSEENRSPSPIATPLQAAKKPTTQPQKQTVPPAGNKPKPFKPVNAQTSNSGIFSRFFGKGEKDSDASTPVDIEMVPLGSGENQENQSPIKALSPSKQRIPADKMLQDQSAGKRSSQFKQRGLGIPRRLDFENWVDTIPQ